MKHQYKIPPRFHIAAAIILSLLISQPSQAASKASRLPHVAIQSLNYQDGIVEATPGRRFSLEVTVKAAKDFPEPGRHIVPISFYLVPQEISQAVTRESIARDGLYFGSSDIRSPHRGISDFPVDFIVPETLVGREGTYTLVAWLDPGAQRIKASKNKLFISPLTIRLSDEKYGKAALAVGRIVPDSNAVISDRDQIIGGSLEIESYFSDSPAVSVSFCKVVSAEECIPLKVWDYTQQTYADRFQVRSGVRKNQAVTTLFQLILPQELMTRQITIKTTVEDINQVVSAGSAEFKLSSYAGVPGNLYEDTDFAREVRNRIAQAKSQIRKGRQTGRISNPASLFRIRKGQSRPVKLSAILNTISKNARVILSAAKVNEQDTTTPLVGLKSNLPGSRFNMPDGDFVWLKDIGVTAPPAPERYKGTGFADFSKYLACIPFFCGPNSPDEAGKEPSESCIRSFCGTTLEDLRYGGRNTNLLDEQAGFDKSYSSSGFGARVGVSGQAKVYHDPAVMNYVAASYDTDAFFGVKLFSYSIPIFEIGSQSVYSPTAIEYSMSRSFLKFLGQTVALREGKSSGLELTISQFFGAGKDGSVGIGPISVDLTVEAGAHASLGLSIPAIDSNVGIQGSVSPGASIGATASANVDIGIGDFGIDCTLTLMSDQLPVTATFNPQLNISRKVVTPKLNLNITNQLTGPEGSIDLHLEIGPPGFRVSHSKNVVSFSTGNITTPIYNKNITFGDLSYAP